MASEISCEKFREIGVELALGVLPGRERAGAVAHLERCADCREYIGQLTLLGDRLIGLLPGSEPPVGFESRVAQALTQRAAHEGHAHARASGIPRPGVLGRIRPRVAAAAGAVLLAVGFGGWAVGTAIESTVAGPASTAAVGSGMLWGGFTSADAVGKPAGEVYAHPGSPGWIYMTVDLAKTGTPHEGRVTCRLVRKDGTTIRVGDFTLHQGRGSWGGPATVDPAKLAGARVIAPDGTVLARAHFATGEENS
ncbi:anti-sigma factor family protein [Streptomyces sp. NPDC001275]